MAYFDLVNDRMVLSSNEVSEIVSSLALQIRKYSELKESTDVDSIHSICVSRLDVLEPLFVALNKAYLNNFNFVLSYQRYE